MESEEYEFEEMQAVREREASIEMILNLYIQPCLLVVGFICNVLAMVVVLATPSLKRQSRGVYVLAMAVLDNWLLVITGLYILAAISTPIQDALFKNLHGCRIAPYAYHLSLASQWFLPIIVWEICLACYVPKVWRKLSTPRVAASLVFILVVFNILYCLVPVLGAGMELEYGFCFVKHHSVYVTTRKVDLALYDILPLLGLALALPVLCRGNKPGRRQDFASAQPANVRGYPPYHLFDQGTSATTTATTTTTTTTTQASIRTRIAYDNLSLPVVSFVFFTVFILPFAIYFIMAVLNPNLPTSGIHAYRAMHMLWLCFFQFKLFVYIIGWREFRERFVQLARKMAFCRKAGSSSEEEAAIVLDMVVPSEVGTTSTNDE